MQFWQGAIKVFLLVLFPTILTVVTTPKSPCSPELFAESWAYIRAFHKHQLTAQQPTPRLCPAGYFIILIFDLLCANISRPPASFSKQCEHDDRQTCLSKCSSLSPTGSVWMSVCTLIAQAGDIIIRGANFRTGGTNLPIVQKVLKSAAFSMYTTQTFMGLLNDRMSELSLFTLSFLLQPSCIAFLRFIASTH